jgi:hypothetical protein
MENLNFPVVKILSEMRCVMQDLFLSAHQIKLCQGERPQ